MPFNVLLTGNTSFLGQNYLEYNRLRDAKAKILCITRRLPNHEHKTSDINYLFLSQPADMSMENYLHLIEENQVNAIIHTAALVGEGKGSWSDYHKVNVDWTLNLARAFAKSETEHRAFVYVSSVGVYGTIPSVTPADEATPFNPDGYYHKSKVLAEKRLSDMSSENDFPLMILRPTIMYGKHDLGFLWKLIKISRTLVLPLPVDTKIHLLDVRTMVSAIDSCLFSPSQSKVLIVGDRDPIKLRSLLSFLEDRIPGIRTIEISNRLADIIDRFSIPLRRHVNVTLLCKSWFYDTTKLRSSLNIESDMTTDRITDYVGWYSKTC